MLFIGQRQSLLPRSESMQRPKEKREIGHRLRQGPRLRLIAWAEAKKKVEADITRLSDKARETVEFEARVRKNSNAVFRAAEEAASKIRFSAKIQGEKREKAEAEARKNVDGI